MTAKSDGEWAAAVDLRRGRNQFDVTSLDPETGKRSEGVVSVFITVPFLEIEAPKLAVEQPSDGASFENGAIPVAGTATNAATVVVSATYVGPSGPAPAGGKATPAPPPAPPSVTASVGDDGTYSTPYELTAGKWLITVTASGPDGKTAALTRAVTVGYKGVNLVVTAKGGRAWVKVWVDGKLDPGVGAAGQVLANGKSLKFTGKNSVEVRTGSSGVTRFTLERHPARGARSIRGARDLAVRPAQGARKDPAALGRGRRPARRAG